MKTFYIVLAKDLRGPMWETYSCLRISSNDCMFSGNDFRREASIIVPRLGAACLT